MFKRKLAALDHPNPSGFSGKEDNEFQNFILWLEDQKIRHWKIEERAGLREINSTTWPDSLNEYLEAIQCPVDPCDRNALIDWMLGFAVRLEYGDNADKYKKVGPKTDDTSSTEKHGGGNPLNELDFDSPDFKAGVTSLASLLQIPPHSDHKVLMQAISALIKEKMNKEIVAEVEKQGVKPMKHIVLQNVDLGFKAQGICGEAGRILRLLHIHELREIQTRCNEAIVAVQALTADPKTDTKLGKVGR